jgi:acetyl esterase/lipase
MPSLQGRFFLWLLQHRNLLKFRRKEEKTDWSTREAVLNFRRQAEEGAARFGKVPQEIECVPVDIEGIPGEWIRPAGSMDKRVILFTHGGGYISGSITDHRGVVAKMVNLCQIGALLFEYRLAPEHPFPAAVEDSVAAYRWLLSQGFKPEQIVLAGDSAGGGLALALLLALKEKGIAQPAGAVAISPWTDLLSTGESYQTNAKVCLSPEGTWIAFGDHYADGQDKGHPLISPLYGDLRDLPPLFITTGGAEVLRDDAIQFADKARQAGVDVTLIVGEGLFHCYPVMAPLFPEATQAMTEICGFIRKQLGVDQASQS